MMISPLAVALAWLLFAACACACAEPGEAPSSLELPAYAEAQDLAPASTPVLPDDVPPRRRFASGPDWRSGKWADEEGIPLGPERPCPQADLDRMFETPGVVQRLRDQWWVLRPALPFLEGGESQRQTPEVYSDGLLRVTLVEFPISRGYGGTAPGRAWGYVDRDGSVVIPPVFAEASTFSEGLAAVRPLGQACVGFIDPSGAWAIPCSEDLSVPAYFSEGLAAMRGFYVDRTGATEIVPAGPDAPIYLGAFQHGRADASTDEAYGILDRRGRFEPLDHDGPMLLTNPDDLPRVGWPTALWDAYRRGVSEGRRVRGDACTFEVTDERGRVVFDHIPLDPVWLLASENWLWPSR